MDMNVSQHYKADSHNYQTETAEGRGTGTWEYVKFPLIWDRTVPQSLQARGCKMTWPVSHEVNRETQGIEPTWLVPQSAVTQHMTLLAFTLPASTFGLIAKIFWWDFFLWTAIKEIKDQAPLFPYTIMFTYTYYKVVLIGKV